MEENKKNVFEMPTNETISTYKNGSIVKANTGDPFIFRHNGRYYLYYSPGRGNDTRCFVSRDLVKWDGPFCCLRAVDREYIEDEAHAEGWASSFAPEVTYFNGKFYLQASLGGTGHRFFVSDSPMGPFKLIPGNQGCKIDGHIFIDNDGKWYFYYANGAGIQCRDMTSPYTIDTEGDASSTGAIIKEGAGSWTEGPMVVYDRGRYYLTYTGNHFLHRSYRIEYAISKGDLKHFNYDDNSAVFVSTTDVMSGIGHSSSVKGPDLDSYFIAYHTRNGARFTNIDRLIFNGDVMTVMGPTVSPVPVPAMPELYTFFDLAGEEALFDGDISIHGGWGHTDGRAILKKALSRDTYTIEATTKNIEKGARAGIIFGYEDENNFGSALFDTATEEMVITFTVDGRKTEYREALVRSFDIPYDFDAIQSIQVEKTGNIFTFFVNDRELCKKESALSGRRVGISAEGGASCFGYLGANSATNGEGAKEYYKPIGTQSGYILALYAKENDLKCSAREDNGEEFLVLEDGRCYNYRVYGERAGAYSLLAHYRSEKGATLSVYYNGEYKTDIILAPTESFASAIARGAELGAGAGVISVAVKNGSADLLYIKAMCEDETPSIAVDESTPVSYSDGTKWSVSGRDISVEGSCKRLFGSYMMGDMTVSADITLTESAECGILARVTNPGEATFARAENKVETTDAGAAKAANWMQGYYVRLTKDTVYLHKVDYSRALGRSAVASAPVSAEGAVKLTVRCEKDTVTVLVNGEAVIEYKDAEPYLCGMAGVRSSSDSRAEFRSLSIMPV